MGHNMRQYGIGRQYDTWRCYHTTYHKEEGWRHWGSREGCHPGAHVQVSHQDQHRILIFFNAKYHLYFQTLNFILSLFQGWNDPWLRCWLCHGPSWILPSCLNFPRYLSIYKNVKQATHIMSCFKFLRFLKLLDSAPAIYSSQIKKIAKCSF